MYAAARKIALDFPQVQQKLPDVSTNNMYPEHFAASMAAALENRQAQARQQRVRRCYTKAAFL